MIFQSPSHLDLVLQLDPALRQCAFLRPRSHTLYAKGDAEPVGNGEDYTDPSAKRSRLNGARNNTHVPIALPPFLRRRAGSLSASICLQVASATRPEAAHSNVCISASCGVLLLLEVFTALVQVRSLCFSDSSGLWIWLFSNSILHSDHALVIAVFSGILLFSASRTELTVLSLWCKE